MATFPVNKIRNVCIMGHGGDGKTSLVESLLFTSGVTDRVGKVPEGNTVCDLLYFAAQTAKAVRCFGLSDCRPDFRGQPRYRRRC